MTGNGGDVARRRPRLAPLVFGVVLTAIGLTAALTAQTGLTLAQTSSLALLVGALVILVAVLTRGRPASP